MKCTLSRWHKQLRGQNVRSKLLCHLGCKRHTGVDLQNILIWRRQGPHVIRKREERKKKEETLNDNTPISCQDSMLRYKMDVTIVILLTSWYNAESP
jgi:hypothetical protein